MQYRALGNTGLSVSVIGLGCNHLGARRRGRTRSDMARLLKHALSRGITLGALRYVTDLPGVSTVLTGTTSIAHLDENVAALAGPRLGDEELAWLGCDRMPATAESAGSPR